MNIAVLNTGTATVKAALVDTSAEPMRTAFHTVVDIAGEDGDARHALEDALHTALGELPGRRLDGIAHRVVHGGVEFVQPVRIDAAVERALASLDSLAPLHNPPALCGIRLAREILPEVPAVAVFDTAFHAERSPVSRLYGLPWDLTRSHALYRYGFHGTAHASLVEGLARLRGSDTRSVDAVTLQLGSGCSACAVANGCSIETSMGFTPLEGLLMATRAGDIDPSIVFHLVRSGHSLDGVEALLNRESGLRGIAGSSDMAQVLRAERAGDHRAGLGVDVFVRRVVATVGAYFTLLGGRGSLVFGGGIGANSPEIRRRVAAGLEAWDVELDAERNESGAAPGRISKPGFREVWALETCEEPLIAKAAAETLLQAPTARPRARTGAGRSRAGS